MAQLKKKKRWHGNISVGRKSSGFEPADGDITEHFYPQLLLCHFVFPYCLNLYHIKNIFGKKLSV
jgi:hypothetical protein